MNRRGFLKAIVAAPIAAVMAPAMVQASAQRGSMATLGLMIDSRRG